MPSFRPAPECCSCLCPVLICPVFIRFLRYDFWQQRQLEKSHGWWSGRGSTWKERALTENIVMQVLLQGGGGKTRWRFCVCLCVFPRSEGANHWTLWRIQLLGGLATLRKPGNQRCVCVCVSVCASETVVCSCTFYLLWTLSNLPGPAESPPAALFFLCADYFLQHSELPQFPNQIHTTLKHVCLWQNLAFRVVSKVSNVPVIPAAFCRVTGWLVLKLKVTFLGFAPTQEAF